jgi:hypothetical protein
MAITPKMLEKIAEFFKHVSSQLTLTKVKTGIQIPTGSAQAIYGFYRHPLTLHNNNNLLLSMNPYLQNAPDIEDLSEEQILSLIEFIDSIHDFGKLGLAKDYFYTKDKGETYFMQKMRLFFMLHKSYPGNRYDPLTRAVVRPTDYNRQILKSYGGLICFTTFTRSVGDVEAHMLLLALKCCMKRNIAAARQAATTWATPGSPWYGSVLDQATADGIKDSATPQGLDQEVKEPVPFLDDSGGSYKYIPMQNATYDDIIEFFPDYTVVVEDGQPGKIAFVIDVPGQVPHIIAKRRPNAHGSHNPSVTNKVHDGLPRIMLCVNQESVNDSCPSKSHPYSDEAVDIYNDHVYVEDPSHDRNPIRQYIPEEMYYAPPGGNIPDDPYGAELTQWGNHRHLLPFDSTYVIEFRGVGWGKSATGLMTYGTVARYRNHDRHYKDLGCRINDDLHPTNRPVIIDTIDKKLTMHGMPIDMKKPTTAQGPVKDAITGITSDLGNFYDKLRAYFNGISAQPAPGTAGNPTRNELNKFIEALNYNFTLKRAGDGLQTKGVDFINKFGTWFIKKKGGKLKKSENIFYGVDGNGDVTCVFINKAILITNDRVCAAFAIYQRIPVMFTTLDGLLMYKPPKKKYSLPALPRKHAQLVVASATAINDHVITPIITSITTPIDACLLATTVVHAIANANTAVLATQDPAVAPALAAAQANPIHFSAFNALIQLASIIQSALKSGTQYSVTGGPNSAKVTDKETNIQNLSTINFQKTVAYMAASSFGNKDWSQNPPCAVGQHIGTATHTIQAGGKKLIGGMESEESGNEGSGSDESGSSLSDAPPASPVGRQPVHLVPASPFTQAQPVHLVPPSPLAQAQPFEQGSSSHDDGARATKKPKNKNIRRAIEEFYKMEKSDVNTICDNLLDIEKLVCDPDENYQGLLDNNNRMIELLLHRNRILTDIIDKPYDYERMHDAGEASAVEESDIDSVKELLHNVVKLQDRPPFDSKPPRYNNLIGIYYTGVDLDSLKRNIEHISHDLLGEMPSERAEAEERATDQDQPPERAMQEDPPLEERATEQDPPPERAMQEDPPLEESEELEKPDDNILNIQTRLSNPYNFLHFLPSILEHMFISTSVPNHEIIRTKKKILIDYLQNIVLNEHIHNSIIETSKRINSVIDDYQQAKENKRQEFHYNLVEKIYRNNEQPLNYRNIFGILMDCNYIIQNLKNKLKEKQHTRLVDPCEILKLQFEIMLLIKLLDLFYIQLLKIVDVMYINKYICPQLFTIEGEDNTYAKYDDRHERANHINNTFISNYNHSDSFDVILGLFEKKYYDAFVKLNAIDPTTMMNYHKNMVLYLNDWNKIEEHNNDEFSVTTIDNQTYLLNFIGVQKTYSVRDIYNKFFNIEKPFNDYNKYRFNLVDYKNVSNKLLMRTVNFCPLIRHLLGIQADKYKTVLDIQAIDYPLDESGDVRRNTKLHTKLLENAKYESMLSNSRVKLIEKEEEELLETAELEIDYLSKISNLYVYYSYVCNPFLLDPRQLVYNNFNTLSAYLKILKFYENICCMNMEEYNMNYNTTYVSVEIKNTINLPILLRLLINDHVSGVSIDIDYRFLEQYIGEYVNRQSDIPSQFDLQFDLNYIKNCVFSYMNLPTFTLPPINPDPVHRRYFEELFRRVSHEKTLTIEYLETNGIDQIINNYINTYYNRYFATNIIKNFTDIPTFEMISAPRESAAAASMATDAPESPEGATTDPDSSSEEEGVSEKMHTNELLFPDINWRSSTPSIKPMVRADSIVNVSEFDSLNEGYVPPPKNLKLLIFTKAFNIAKNVIPQTVSAKFMEIAQQNMGWLNKYFIDFSGFTCELYNLINGKKEDTNFVIQQYFIKIMNTPNKDFKIEDGYNRYRIEETFPIATEGGSLKHNKTRRRKKLRRNTKHNKHLNQSLKSQRI